MKVLLCNDFFQAGKTSGAKDPLLYNLYSDLIWKKKQKSKLANGNVIFCQNKGICIQHVL